MGARAAIAGALILGAALRLYPVWFGLPYAHARPDETTALGAAVGLLRGDPNPHFFNWPSLTFYLLAGLFRLAGAVKGTLTTADHFVIARTAVALAGTLTILFLARIARRTADDRTAAVSALFLAVAVLHARDSHFATVDVLMTMFATACLMLVLEATADPSPRALMLAGFIGGLAMSTKYSAAPLVLTVMFIRPGALPRPRDVLLFGVAFGAGFLALTPYAAIDYPQFSRDVGYERLHLAVGHGVDLGRGWSYHPTRSLPYGLGFGIYAAAIAGVLPWWRRHRRAALPIAAFAVAIFAAVGMGRTVFFRYIMPLVPIACLSAAIAVTAASQWLARRIRLSEAVIASALAIALAAPSLVTTIRIDRLLARTDSRVIAADWLRPMLRPEDTLADVGGVIGLDLNGVEFHDWRFDKASATFVNAGERLPDWLVLYDSPLDYAELDPRMDRLALERYDLAYEVRGVGSARRSLFDPQDAFFLPVFGFSGIDRPGPDVFIYRRAR